MPYYLADLLVPLWVEKIMASSGLLEVVQTVMWCLLNDSLYNRHEHMLIKSFLSHPYYLLRCWRMWLERNLCCWCVWCLACVCCRQSVVDSSWWSWWWSRPSLSKPSTQLILIQLTACCSAHDKPCPCSPCVKWHTLQYFVLYFDIQIFFVN